MSNLALLGGRPTRAEPYPTWPVFDARDIAAVTAVIQSGQWGGYPYPGPQSQEFIRHFAEMQGGGYPVLMINGTVTMEVAMRDWFASQHPYASSPMPARRERSVRGRS